MFYHLRFRLHALVVLIVLCIVACDDEENTGLRTITGKLNYSGKPVKDAIVDVDGMTQYQAVSDANGEFTITGVTAGLHTLNLNKRNSNGSFSTITESIDVNNNLTLNNLVLPEPVALHQMELTQNLPENTLTLSWSPYITDDFREYKLYEHNSSGLDETTGTLIHVTTMSTDTTFTLTLPHNSEKYYRVFVLDETNQIAGSNVLHVVTGPVTNNLDLEIGTEHAFYLNQGQELWFSFDATAGEIYGISWFDQFITEYSSYVALQEYTAGSIFVSAWREDKTTPYFYDERMIQMGGAPFSVKAVANEKIYVKVKGFLSGNEGTFGLKITHHPANTAFLLATNGSDYSIPIALNDVKLLSFDAAAGTTYEINAVDPGDDPGIATWISIHAEDAATPLVARTWLRTSEWVTPWEVKSDANQKIFIVIHGSFWYYPTTVSINVIQK